MKLAILGGGGFRVPLVYRALLGDTGTGRVDQVALHDVDPSRLAGVSTILKAMAGGSAEAPAITPTGELEEAITGADFVFMAIRVGGLSGRVADERVALDLGLLGQETTGPGGIAYGLRTVPVAQQIAQTVGRVAPHAWVINFTNPAGLITEAMQSVLGARVVGICDSPIALGRRAARALGYRLDEVELGYVGINHLGWLRSLSVNGKDLLPDLLADDAALAPLEETHLFGADWLRTLGAVPNEYLHYYYFTKEALASAQAAPMTRGEFLRSQQTAFYDRLAASPGTARAQWEAVLAERNSTYMQQARGEGVTRDAEDIVSGGYEGVALSLMRALTRNEAASLILNVANGDAVQGLPRDAVVEVPCIVDGHGVRPVIRAQLEAHMLGLTQQVKAVDRLVIEAATTRSPERAVEAFALHPLVDSVSSARALLAGYRARIPEVDAVFAT